MKKRILALFTAFVMVLTLLPVTAGAVLADETQDPAVTSSIEAAYQKAEALLAAEEESKQTSLRGDGPVAEEAVYTRPATLAENLPGVYVTKAHPGDSKEGDNPATIGIPSVAKQTLDAQPTKESPAIIMGAAANYERKTGPTTFEPFVPGTERIAPYSYFRWGVIQEERKDPDGTITVHEKLSGFDGTYFIVRVDVSEIIKDKGEDQFLHVKQESNSALMVAYGMEGSTFSNALGAKTGSYSLKDNAKALKDTTGFDQETPYFDVILMSSGKLVAGADAGQPDALSADVQLSFYVDGTEDYNPDLKLLDTAQMPTTWPAEICGQTFENEQKYIEALLAKFFKDENMTQENTATSYLVKGSDLEIDVTVDGQKSFGAPADFWSLTKAMDYQAYDSHVIKLICEAPVLEGLHIQSIDGNERSVILDVNSFDIQIANNTEQNKAGLTIEKDASLRIMDGTNTSGAELAIGNNATMLVKKDGVLIIDESCTNEVEYDAATAVDPSQSPTGEQVNGEITIEEGGTIINYGVINIEGTEAKPLDPSQVDPQPVTDMKPADMIICKGGQLQNYGCISLKGILYVLGDLFNFGKYDDTIVVHDPDKGTTTYHKGIQVTWKDVVTREGVEPGILNVGIDAAGNIEPSASLTNCGDIVFFPGTLNLHGTFRNVNFLGTDGRMFFCFVDKAIIPVIDPNDPLHVEDIIDVDPPKKSVFNNQGTVEEYEGTMIGRAQVELLHNGIPGELTVLTDTIDDAEVTVSGNEFNYNGEVQKPTVTSVKKNGIELEEGIDYFVSYSDDSSKDAGEYTVTVNGKGTFSGAVESAYKINAISIDKATVTLSKSEFYYNGEVRIPTVKSVVLNGTTLKSGTDYEITYSDDSSTNVGTYTVTVTGTGNYTGTVKTTYKINKAQVTATVTLSTTSFTFNNKVQKPTVKSVVLNGATLKKGTDYTVAYSNSSSKNAGTYTVKITGTGNYSGSVNASYKIVKAGNTLTVKAKSKTVSAAAVKKKAQTIKRAGVLTISNAKGTVTYAKSSGNSKITIDKKTGNVTVAKGLKAGTYKVKVNVTAAGDTNYKSLTKAATFTITVK